VTAQYPEKLYFRGNEYRLIVEPLEMYFKTYLARPKIRSSSTANYRGYIGTWKIENGKLYLEKLNSRDGKEMELKTKLFPEADGSVFAGWYSGTLICPHGEMDQYVHAGYASTYERYLLLNVEQGELKGEQDLSLEEYNEWCSRRQKDRATIPGKRTAEGKLFLAASMLAGGLASAALAHRLIDDGAGSSFLPLALGAAFGGLGWLLAENIGEAIVFLLITSFMGAMALFYLQSETLRIVVIAFLCGFNIGKLAGGVYRESK
jgi:hypothetical protein